MAKKIYILSFPVTNALNRDREDAENLEGTTDTREGFENQLNIKGVRIRPLYEHTTDLNDEYYPTDEWVAWVFIEE